MRNERGILRAFGRVVLQLAVVAGGLVLIWGSGGGGWPESGPIPSFPTLVVEPERATTSVGGSVEFRAYATNADSPRYQWCRSPPGGGSCLDIPGATGATYSVVGANLADDGARYVVKMVSGENVVTRSAYLAVSSMPGVVYQEGEFAPSDWSLTAILSPSENGPTYSATRPSTGGNPGAYVRVSYSLSPGWSVRVLHLATTATYDPASQGAIYRVDFSEDCAGTDGDVSPYSIPMLQQGGRTYGAIEYRRWCSSSAWASVRIRPSLRSVDFARIDGPGCAAGESCPDFSATGAPIALGLLTEPSVYQNGRVHGIDNWRVTVWRR